jgi:hypothetical protein
MTILILPVFTALTVRTAIFYDVTPYFGSSAQDDGGGSTILKDINALITYGITSHNTVILFSVLLEVSQPTF